MREVIGVSHNPIIREKDKSSNTLLMDDQDQRLMEHFHEIWNEPNQNLPNFHTELAIKGDPPILVCEEPSIFSTETSDAIKILKKKVAEMDEITIELISFGDDCMVFKLTMAWILWIPGKIFCRALPRRMRRHVDFVLKE